MGQMRVQTKQGGDVKSNKKAVATKVKQAGTNKAKVVIKSTFNNTSVFLYNSQNGELLVWSTSGRSGFKGTRKGTPYAAGVTASNVAQQALDLGIKEVEISVKGIGQGRDQAIRAIANSGLEIDSLKDNTPIPHNGPRAKKPRKS
jgi:small subunit ribosomal protein S11